MNKQEQAGSSYPYVSGDFFKYIADYTIESQSDLDLIKYVETKTRLLYFSVSFLEVNSSYLIDFLNHNPFLFSNKNNKCIIHNGDAILPTDFLYKLSTYFKIYLVNYVSKDPLYTPLPIGLENISVGRSGSLFFFNKWKNIFTVNNDIKSNILFTSFNIYTNYSARKPLEVLLNKSRFEFSSTKHCVSDYLDMIASSYFTLSPQGNGFDCHRTWEAIYLKCVPVVLSGTLHSNFTDNLPILVVNKWEDFFEFDDSELIVIYNKIIHRSVDLALADYWLNELKK